MKHLLLLLLLGILIEPVLAQNHDVGHTTITFNDPARTGGFGSGGGPGRQIQSEVYYPADMPGDDVAVTSGTFPVIVFGHGFVMAWDAYENIWEELVPQGYIMVFPRTEGGFSPSHDEFAQDLAHLVNEMQVLNGDNASLFHTHVDTRSAIMGHSMGGGASFLAASNNTTIETVIGLAPAETNPSAIAAAANVSVPAVVFSGSSDGVTPAADHHLPIYNALDVSCKHFISITGGAHCYFANSNFNCDFGEGTASSGITVTRTEQQTIMNDYVGDWLDYKLKGNVQGYTDFVAALPSDQRITYMDSCSVVIQDVTEVEVLRNMEVYPNPAQDQVNLNFGAMVPEMSVRLLDATGRVLSTQNHRMTQQLEISLSNLPSGIYLLQVETPNGKHTKRVVKQ